VKIYKTRFTLQYTKMKLLFTLILTSSIFAQSFALLDSLSIGTNKKDISFYSLTSKAKTTITNDDWHLAFSSKSAAFPSNTLQSAAIRINEANGVSVYKVPGLGLNDFNILDTTGWRSWKKIHDSDTLIWMGAFNRNLDPNDQFNYGWGSYSFAAHSVVGDSLFLVQLPDGSLKKLAILKNEWDTAFIIRYSAISASQATDLLIPKKPYKPKNFAYVDMNLNTIADREPLGTDWDFNFSIYADASGNKKVGLLLNNGVTALGNQTYDAQNPCPFNIAFNDDYNALGTLGSNDVLDSNVVSSHVSYIRTANGRVFSLQFSPPNLTTNTIYFTTTLCSGANSITDDPRVLALSIYPNPAQDYININSTAAIVAPAQLLLSDMAGKVCIATTLNDTASKLNIAQLENGVYFLRMTINDKSSTTKLVVNR